MLQIKKCEKLPKVQYTLNPRFGTVFAPHLLRINIKSENLSDLVAEILPFERELFAPSTSVLHYGQSIFEGLKIYRQPDETVAAFRADLHAKRFMKSSQRMAMPIIGEEAFMECLREYMKMEQESVPSEADHSLYIRPLLFGRDEVIKVGRAKTYTFYIMSSIAGPYFHGGTNQQARVMVNRQFVRAFPGGLGEIKTAANYAASLGPQTHAEKYKCDQVLYLDGIKHDLIDELGGMNFFAIRDGELVTPDLSGTILDGVTRRSILEIAPTLGFKAKEEPLSFTELCRDIQKGRVTEAFACGTAAVIHSIGEFVVQDTTTSEPTLIKLPESTPISSKVLETLKKVQRGVIAAPGKWLFKA